MFWLRNKKNNFQLHTLIWGTGEFMVIHLCGPAAAAEILAVNKRLYITFMDIIERAFDCVPSKAIQWVLRKLSVEELILR